MGLDATSKYGWCSAGHREVGTVTPVTTRREDILRVDNDALTRLTAELGGGEMIVPDWRLEVYPQSDDATFIQFIGVMNALNYCFFNPSEGEKFAVYWRGATWGGATGLCAALQRALDNGDNILDVGRLGELTITEAEGIFSSDGGALPLLRERVAYLNSLSASLAKYQGSFAEMVKECNYDATEIIAHLVTEFAAYGGDSCMDPETKEWYRFDKRARLFCLIYEGRARSSAGKLPTLENIDQVGAPVDYQLPRMLRDRGVLVYGEELSRKVDNGVLIPAGSEEELTLRLSTEAAIGELLVGINAQREKKISMVELDFALWVGGRQAAGRHHLTMTTAY